MQHCDKKGYNLLREAIRLMLARRQLIERDDELPDDLLDRMLYKQTAAQRALKNAMKELNQWDEENAKRQSYKDLIATVGRAAAEKARVNNPEQYRYDVKILSKSRRNLDNKVAAAARELLKYEKVPEFEELDPEFEIEKEPEPLMPEEGKPIYYHISDIVPGKFYPWDDPRFSKASLLTLPDGFERRSKNDLDDLDKKVSAPGEVRLATLFGGRQQGSGRPYDIVTRENGRRRNGRSNGMATDGKIFIDGKKWEVKGLHNPSEKIRPGKKGISSMAQADQEFIEVISQMKRFLVLVDGAEETLNLSDDERKVIQYTRIFFRNHDEKIMSRELGEDRLALFKRRLIELSEIRQTWLNQLLQHRDGPYKLHIKGFNKPLNIELVSLPELMNFLQRNGLLKTRDVSSLRNLLPVARELRKLLVATLGSDAFIEPRQWFKDWASLIKPEDVFDDVSGVFLVTPKGFLLVPRGWENDAFALASFSQAKPKFRIRKTYLSKLQF